MLETPLCALARKYGTDKGGMHAKYASGRCHNYTPSYYEMWKDRRDDSLTILEIGAQNGHSVQMWAEFFPSARVYGWDIDVKQYSYPPNPRIEIWQVPLGRFHDWMVVPEDAGPPLHALYKMGNPQFDFIVDDGSHCDSQQQLALDVLLPFLKKDGIFCIEDHDTLQPPDVRVTVPKGYTLEVLCEFKPWPDSLLQVIRHG